METQRQNLLSKLLTHSNHCHTCKSAKGINSNMCPIGQAIVYAYGHDVRDVNFTQMQELERLTWDELAMATLRADDEPDEVWVTCLDVLVAQKVEMIWAMSEAFWEGKHRPWIDQRRLR